MVRYADFPAARMPFDTYFRSGFERFAQGQLITLFSATNYCGTANNAGAILVLGRDLVVYPKLIHPLPPQAALDDSPVLDRGMCFGALASHGLCADHPSQILQGQQCRPVSVS